MKKTDSLTQLNAIQQAYFELIENHPLIKEIRDLGNGQYALPQRLFDSHNIILPTSKGWSTPAIKYLEDLVDSIFNFWSINGEKQRIALSNLCGNFIHVDDKPAIQNLRKYGLFFRSILISDQILMSGLEFKKATDVANPAQFVATVADSAYRCIKFKKLFLPENNYPLAYIVPATHPITESVYKAVNDAASSMAASFFSELTNNQFDTPYEFFPYVRSKSINIDKLNPDLLSRIYSVLSATNIQDYKEKRAKIIMNDLGQDLGFKDPPEALLVYDITARFEEYERFSADAFRFGQEVEIPDGQLELYEPSYSEDFICKVAPHSEKLGFLNKLQEDDFISFLWSEKTEELKNDLALYRYKIRRGNEKLRSVIDGAGEYINSRLEQFIADSANAKKQTFRDSLKIGGAFIATSVITLAAAAFPPLSAVTLLWGKTVSDLLSERNKQTKLYTNKMDRPIATLAKWKETLS